MGLYWLAAEAERGEKVSVEAAALEAMWQRNMTAGLYKDVSNKHNRSGAVRAC